MPERGSGMMTVFLQFSTAMLDQLLRHSLPPIFDDFYCNTSLNQKKLVCQQNGSNHISFGHALPAFNIPFSVFKFLFRSGFFFPVSLFCFFSFLVSGFQFLASSYLFLVSCFQFLDCSIISKLEYSLVGTLEPVCINIIHISM